MSEKNAKGARRVATQALSMDFRTNEMSEKRHAKEGIRTPELL